MKYLLGVDGGNTKTDYFLFDVDGNFIAMYRDGTCSHEGLSDGFAGSYRVMKNVFDKFFKEQNVDINDIEAACFGLAGCDVPYQHEELVKIVSNLGFKNFVVVNDSLIPVKAGTTKGYGACSICGTGTSSSGIGIDQEVLQVGGIGSVTGDEAGGRALARLVVTAAYSEEFRAGEKTTLTKIVKDALGVTDKKMFMQKIVDVFYKRGFDYNQFTVACFEEANKGDKVALNILTDLAEGLAHSVSGTVLNLNLDEHPEVVLAGGVYVKGSCKVLVDTVKRRVNELTGKECIFNLLSVPPATGSIIWAKEIYDGKFPSLEERKKIIERVSIALESKK